MYKGNIVKNFTLDEMANNSATDKVKLIITPEMVTFAFMIQELRDFYKKPMVVNSWYRTRSYNKSVFGSANSAHLDGRAVDLAVREDPWLTLTYEWLKICKRYNKIGGVNYYDSFMHFCNYEDKFGYRDFVIRDLREQK